MKVIQNSTFDLLKNLDSNLYIEYSLKIVLKTIDELKKRHFKSILFVINSEIEPNIYDVIVYCFKHHYDCYLLIYKSNSFVIKKLDDLNIGFDFYLYTKTPIYFSSDINYNNISFDLVYVPILNFDEQKNFIDTQYSLINNLLKKISYKNLWGYCFSFQKYLNLSEYSNQQVDIVINNNEVIK